MCFNQPASLAFGLYALGTAAFLRSRGHPPRRYGIFLYFSLMEFIQFLAYSVVDQCNNPWNKALTLAAFAHVVMQNTVVNWFLLCPENGVHRDVTKLVLSMCILCGLSTLLIKIPWPVWLGAPLGLLDSLAQLLPEFYSYRTAGTEEACRHELMCGPQVCTFMTPNHIAWTVPLLPPSYFLPHGYVHFLFMFMPAIIMCNMHVKLAMIGAFLTGPLFTQLLATRNMPTYKSEWPATWCFLSVSQCTVALLAELYTIHKSQNQEAAKPHVTAAQSPGHAVARPHSPDSLVFITEGRTGGPHRKVA